MAVMGRSMPCGHYPAEQAPGEVYDELYGFFKWAAAGEEIEKNRGIYYDPDVAEACLKAIKAGRI